MIYYDIVFSDAENHLCGKARRGRIEQQQVTVLHVIRRGRPFKARGHRNHHILVDTWVDYFNGESPIFNGEIHGFRLRFSLKPIQWLLDMIGDMIGDYWWLIRTTILLDILGD